jgi:2-methylcitrate dehydratase PrpD
MADKPSVTRQICDWLCGVSYDALPAEVRSKTLDVIFDSLGCMIACSTLPEVRAVVDLLEELGGRAECTIIGRRDRSSVVSAAMAHGAMAHGDEVDPVHATSVGGHVAAGPVPTALTVGQWVDAAGKDIVRAVALGYEFGGRLMTLLYRERDYVARRFYHTAVAGALSSAVTASLLLRLGRDQMRAALGLAAYQAAGPDNLTKDPGHMGKTFQVAAANRNGVTAALLAQKGSFVPLDILDGAAGFFDAFLQAPEIAGEMLTDLGKYYSITDVMHKRYSVGTPNLTYLHGLFQMLREHAIRADDIHAIEIELPSRSVHRIPTTRHASISGDVVSAVAAAYGKVEFDQIHDAAVPTRPEVRRMQQCVRLIGRSDWKDMEHGRHAVVTITTTTGQTWRKEVWHEPMTRQELEEKFHGLVTPRLGHDRTARVKLELEQIEQAPSIRPLMEQLAGA